MYTLEDQRLEPTAITHLERKMIWTKPPGNYVPAVNLQGCKLPWFLDTCPLPLFHHRNHQETMCDVLKSEPKLMPRSGGKMGGTPLTPVVCQCGKQLLESNLAMCKSLSWWIYWLSNRVSSHSRQFTGMRYAMVYDGKNGILSIPSRTNSYFEEMVTSQLPNNPGDHWSHQCGLLCHGTNSTYIKLWRS